MKKFIKYSAYGIGGLLLLAIAAAAIIAAIFNPNDYKPLVVKLVQEKKQRTLHIEGDIRLAFWPKLGADLGKVSLSEHHGDKEFASIKGAKVSLALLPLLKKQLVVDTVYIDGARANIVRYKDGTTNFDDLLSKEEESEQIKFDIDGVNVTSSAVSFTDEKAGAKYDVTKLNLRTGHVALAKPFDLKTDFHIVANNPKLNATVNLKGNVMADPEAKHFAAKGLDAAVKGDLAGGGDMNVKLSGDVDARPENMEFLLNSLKLVASGNFDGAKLAAEVNAPKLVVLKDELTGKEAQVIFSQDKGNRSMQGKLVLADIKGSPESFQSGGIKAEISAKDGADTLQAKLALADIKGSLKAVQSSGVSGDFTARQGARNIVGKFSSPFAGNLESVVFDLPKLAGSLDIKDPVLPKGAMKGDFAMQLHADIKQQRVVSNFSLNIEETRLKGDVAVSSFKRPDIKFNVNANQLDLNKLLGSTKSAETKPSGNKPADLSALKSLLLDGSVNVGSIVYDKYRIVNLVMHVKADGEKLNISPFSAKVDDSQIKGSVGISQFSKPLYTFDLDIDTLNADRYIGAPAAKKTAKDDKPLDLSALKALNADGSLRIGSLKYGKIQSSNIRIDLKADGEKLKVEPLSAKVDDSQIRASLGITRFNDPVYSFDVNIDKLDADRYITKSESAATSTGDTPIDLSALKKLNASGEAKIGWLKLANIKTENVNVGLRAEGGVATVSPFAANLYQGSTNGTLKVDARSTPSIALRQDMKNVAVGPLLVDAINNDMLEGKGTVNLDITTSGNSVGALKKGLGGTAALSLVDGAVKGIDIPGTIREMKSKVDVFKDKSSIGADQKKRTDFSEMTATFNIKNGVAHNDDLAMKAPILRLAKGDSKGDIDIGNEKINYLAKPTIVKSLKGQGGADLDSLAGFSIPVKITGTFSNPQYGMDFAAIGTALAKSNLLDKVGGEKGAAVKELLGNENKADALKNILGGNAKPESGPAPAGQADATGQPQSAPAEQPGEQPKSLEDQAKEKAEKKLKKLLKF